MLNPEDEVAATVFDEFVDFVRGHFKSVGLLMRPEPWRHSPPEKMERDRIIWELRNKHETWERIAEKANCAVTTAKERYQDMLTAIEVDSS